MQHLKALICGVVIATGITVSQSADATDKDEVIKTFIRKNYQPLDSSNPEQAAIIGWHKAIVSGDYAEWRKYAHKSYMDTATASEDAFRKIRATTPERIYISPKPHHKNPNGSQDWGLTGCKIPEYFDPPFSWLPQPGHPVRLTTPITPHFDGARWVILNSPAMQLFLQADPAPCDDSGLFEQTT